MAVQHALLFQLKLPGSCLFRALILMEILVDHNAKLKALIGNGFAANTLKGYRTTVKHLTAFLQL